MPEHIRTLIVILAFATTVYAVAYRPASFITGVDSFKRRRNLWFVLTVAVFLTQNFWIYAVIATLLLLYTNRRESNPSALFFSLMFLLPVANILVPGLGMVNYLFELSHVKILELLILFPAFLSLRKQYDTLTFGRSSTDKALAAYLLLSVILSLRDTTLTDAIRQSFYLFIDVFLPYYVFSRSLKSMQAFRDAMLGFVLAMMVIAPMAVFESSKKWLLYTSISQVLQLQGQTGYLARDGMLRAMVTTGQPIVLGYLMTVGMGFYLFLQRSIQQKFIRRLGMLLLVAGLFASLSRGPWVGAALLLIVFIATGRYAARRLMSLALAAILALSLISLLPGGERVINLLPFVGSTEKGNVEYREQLIANSMIVINRNLMFGSSDYFKTPEMEAMRQGQGMIDVVNSYLGVTLTTGIAGLGLFVTIFALTLLGIYRAMRSIPDSDSEEYLLGRVLIATLLAILLIIFTVSSITFIPIVYWSVAGMGVAYVQLVRNNFN